MSGYTIGNKTIYKNLLTLKAGEIVFFKDNKYKYLNYFKYYGKIDNKNFEDYKKELSKITLSIFRKILSRIGDRQV